MELYQAAADKNHPRALTKLGDCYMQGHGKEEIHNEWVERRKFNSPYQYWFSFFGRVGVETAKDKGFEFYQKAADLGFARVSLIPLGDFSPNM